MPNVFNPKKFNSSYFEKEYNSQEYSECITLNVLPVNNSTLFRTLINEKREIYFQLQDKRKRPCGVIRIREEDFFKKKYFIVERAFTNHIYRNKGVISFLYKCLIEQNFSIISDSAHTLKGSMNIWKRMSQIAPNKKIFIYNTGTAFKRKYTTQNDYLIWGKESNADFDSLEVEDKIYLVEQMRQGKELSQEQYDYFIEGLNSKKLSDREDIRIIVE